MEFSLWSDFLRMVLSDVNAYFRFDERGFGLSCYLIFSSVLHDASFDLFLEYLGNVKIQSDSWFCHRPPRIMCCMEVLVEQKCPSNSAVPIENPRINDVKLPSESASQLRHSRGSLQLFLHP